MGIYIQAFPLIPSWSDDRWSNNQAAGEVEEAQIYWINEGEVGRPLYCSFSVITSSPARRTVSNTSVISLNLLRLAGRHCSSLDHGCLTCGPPAVAKLQASSSLCLWESCMYLSDLQRLMGLVVPQQLEGHRLSTYALDDHELWKLWMPLQALIVYNSSDSPWIGGRYRESPSQLNTHTRKKEK